MLRHKLLDYSKEKERKQIMLSACIKHKKKMFTSYETLVCIFFEKIHFKVILNFIKNSKKEKSIIRKKFK